MIRWVPGSRLRRRRFETPEPPFWCATSLEPYAGPRGIPVAIEWLESQALPPAMEIGVAQDLETLRSAEEARDSFESPLLIDAAGFGETVYRKGSQLADECTAGGLAAQLLISPEGELPDSSTEVVIVAWPADPEALDALAGSAAARGLRWGLAVPVVPPFTTDLGVLSRLAGIAATRGASFFGAVEIETAPAARAALAAAVPESESDEVWSQLFHDGTEALSLATERHVSAMAREAGIEGWIPPAGWSRKSNWNAAVLLARTASRMLRMEHEVERAWSFARAARAIARLRTPIVRIADTARIGIIDSLGPDGVAILEAWLAGEQADMVDAVDQRWCLRRDHGI